MYRWLVGNLRLWSVIQKMQVVRFLTKADIMKQ